MSKRSKAVVAMYVRPVKIQENLTRAKVKTAPNTNPTHDTVNRCKRSVINTRKEGKLKIKERNVLRLFSLRVRG